ncbi:MAG: M55 family metallopeptidase [Candidatus Eremiobacteraeota bacterium]|nr:M55 family metallopeptidase [Candidatus Eremiobacteraeota bacterium]NNM92021.1 M55 family metallopeptidase [Candidatus Eremiobacteraeota bacterium]
MKLYISCDMEGTAGLCSWEQCDPNNTTEYPIYRRLMSREVRAAIEGARAAEPCDVLVNDAHSRMHNLLFDELPSDIRVLSGYRKALSMVQGGDEGFDGAFFTGYHAGIGVERAVLAHTYSPNVLYGVRINGVECDETLLNAAYLGEFGVPVLLLTGDEALCTSARKHLPWVRCAQVKRSTDYYSTDSLTPAAALALIAETAREAVSCRAEARPFRFTGSVTLDIEAASVEAADYMALIPGFMRPGGRSLRFSAPHYVAAFQALIAAMRIGRGGADRA